MLKPISVLCIVLAVLAEGCNHQRDKDNTKTIDNKITSHYNLNLKYSDSLPDLETLLELIVENNNNFGVMVKVPLFVITNVQTHQKYQIEDLLELSDDDKIPTLRAYEDSLLSRIKNPLRYNLEKYIIDSLSKRGEEIDDMKSNDINGYTFIKPLSKSVFLLDLTILLNKVNGPFKIYAYNNNVIFDYKTNYVPDTYEGYKKVSDNLKFDTLYLTSNRRKD